MNIVQPLPQRTPRIRILPNLPHALPAPDPETLARVAGAAAHLVRAGGQPDFLAVLQAELLDLVRFDNFIVYRFQTDRTADLLFTNLDEPQLRQQMAPYSNGLYLLDPFNIAAATRDDSWFTTLDAIAPEEFTASEYFSTYYKYVDVIDEGRFLVRLGADEFVHVFVERERGGRFEPPELALLRAIEPLVSAAVIQNRRWLAATERAPPPAPPLRFDLRSVLAGMQNGALTLREVDIVELMLMGHSSKSIGRRLQVAEGTVTNHKRNIYAKLELHSQSQLFHVCLQELVGTTVGR